MREGGVIAGFYGIYMEVKHSQEGQTILCDVHNS